MHKFVKNILLLLAIGIVDNTFAQTDTAKWHIQFTDLSTHMRLFGPDKIIRVSQDSAWVYKPTFHFNSDGDFKRYEDTLVYTTGHQINITPLPASIDSLKSSYQNLCMHGGLIFHVHLNYLGTTHETWINNYYHPQIFAILDQINPLLPEPYQIGYSREWLEKGFIDCEKYLNP